MNDIIEVKKKEEMEYHKIVSYDTTKERGRQYETEEKGYFIPHSTHHLRCSCA